MKGNDKVTMTLTFRPLTTKINSSLNLRQCLSYRTQKHIKRPVTGIAGTEREQKFLQGGAELGESNTSHFTHTFP